MSQSRKFDVNFIEYPQTILYYDAVTIDSSDYPELDGKTDSEIIEYIKENAWVMKSTDSEVYDSLGEEISDMELVREKTPRTETGVSVSVFSEDDEDSDDDGEE